MVSQALESATAMARHSFPLFAGTVAAYASVRFIYLLWFHPLARYPGPKIAAVSNIWYAYHWLSGRWPWAIEEVLSKYGDVVRIAPNEVVIVSEQAFIDIYTSHVKYHETFTKTDMNERGEVNRGILFERDAAKHRQTAKQLSPAFSTRATRTKEPILNRYIDDFVERMLYIGAEPDGVDFRRWSDWLAMDISAKITYSREMNQMRDMQNGAVIDVLLRFNPFSTVLQVSKRFPIIAPLAYLFLPFSAMQSFVEVTNTAMREVEQRILKKSSDEYVDVFEQLVPADGAIPTDQRELKKLEVLSGQLLFASWEPPATWFYSVLLHLLNEPKAYRILTDEIRTTFARCEDITVDALPRLEYLTACLEESLRLFPNNNGGLPRVSPGAKVDGHFFPKGVYCQTSIFAFARSSKHFHEPLSYRPQRWLPTTHPLYESQFANDKLKGLFPFSQGPRGCPGKEFAWLEARFFVSKVLWRFDVTKTPSNTVDFEKDFQSWAFWAKPEFRVRFVPVDRS